MQVVRVEILHGACLQPAGAMQEDNLVFGSKGRVNFYKLSGFSHLPDCADRNNASITAVLHTASSIEFGTS